MSSDGVTTTARLSRENGVNTKTTERQEYRIFLPSLPAGKVGKNTVVLHGDITGRPYCKEDFKPPLKELIKGTEIAAFGVYQLNHIWLLTTHHEETKQKLLNAKECIVKGKRCLIIDCCQQEIVAKLHWLPYHVPDDSVRKAFEVFGQEIIVSREKWTDDYFHDVESTTRVLKMKLKEGVTVDIIPHQMRLCGKSVLVSIPGRLPLCLRCRELGHVRRQCRAPRCSKCRRYGHDDESCVRSYASVTKEVREEADENLMDEADMEEIQQDKQEADKEGDAVTGATSSKVDDDGELLEAQVTTHEEDLRDVHSTSFSEQSCEGEHIEVDSEKNEEIRSDQALQEETVEDWKSTLTPVESWASRKRTGGKFKKHVKPNIPYDPRDRGKAQIQQNNNDG
ncbi:uncharacterized protein LOC135378674 [Ornithodoros turicata]|uniref:uncharacterized protein LOC135378674 n=1 Tax=Ornithodoros turicata TaxID=34597 RepID=UPI00313A084E